MKARSILMVKEKETKHTIRYREVEEPHIIGTLYIKKWFAEGAEKILVRIGEPDERNTSD